MKISIRFFLMLCVYMGRNIFGLRGCAFFVLWALCMHTLRDKRRTSVARFDGDDGDGE